MTDEQSTRNEARRRTYLAEVLVSLKPVVNDPQGLAIRDGLRSLGYDEVEAVRAGKYIRVTVDAESPEDARGRVTRMCDQLLSNPVTETYEIQLTPLADH
ncbi:MAG TPA: phosphoribosylformylglycinamidine synthase subunit PurS [Thermomicrobiales bacterium]|nr:phosphoribosylformylglycinamidine synthase subunit PurS [Thermomicrobiales bacterium]